MCFRFLQTGWGFFRTGVLPHHDHGAVDGLDDTEALEEYEEHKFDKKVEVGGVK